MMLRKSVWLMTVMMTVFSGEHSFGSLNPRDHESFDQSSQKLGRFRNTHYYVVSEKSYVNEPKVTDVLRLDGKVLARVSTRFKRAMDIEGTGKLSDGRVLNYAGVVDGEIRYALSRHAWGRGVGDCPLIPFKTIAIDRNEVPLGALVSIPQTRGMKLPDGTLHDGLWRAEDVGGAIKKDRVDLFVGEKSGGEVLRQNGITHLEALEILLVSEPEAENCTQQTPSWDDGNDAEGDGT